MLFELHVAGKNLATLITRVRMALICLMLLETACSEKALATQRTLEFLFVHLVVLFFLP